MEVPDPTDAARLERLWAGQFGDAYTNRNAHTWAGREAFWKTTLVNYPISSVLEVGCNIGANLGWISKLVPPHGIFGIDINKPALERLQQAVPEIHAACAPARELPFRDNAFSLVLTAGLLIHQPECALPLVMAEIVRCSNRYVLCMEYFAETQTEIPYRGQKGALFKRPYGHLYQKMFPDLMLLEQGTLSRGQGWDDITFWMFRKKD